MIRTCIVVHTALALLINDILIPPYLHHYNPRFVFFQPPLRGHILEGLLGWVITWNQTTLVQNFTENLIIILDSSISLHLIATDKFYNGIFQKKFHLFI